jgi:fatty-acyl-CoA synthase
MLAWEFLCAFPGIAMKEVSYKNITIGALLTELGQRLPDHEALVYPYRDLRWSFRRLEEESIKLARGLLALGIQKGDRVSIWATNVPEWVVLQFALAKIGAILVTVNTAFGRREVEYLLQQSETSTLFLISGFRTVNYVQIIRDIVPELSNCKPGELHSANLPFLKRVIFIGGDTEDPNVGPGMLRYSGVSSLAGTVTMDELRRREETLDLDDVINMQYTSGTTGFPKGVMLSHRNILNNGSSLADGLRYTPADRLCLPVPLFHCFGCVIGVLGAYSHGTTLIPLEHFDPHQVLEIVHRERCTAIYGVPTMFIAEMEQPDFDRYDLSNLRTGIMAGSLCPMELMKQVIQKMHLTELCIAYGLTEASPGVTLTAPDDTLERRTATAGRALPGVEVKIAEPETGKELPPGQQGELLTRGYHVMKGYYKNDQATREAITPDGWLRTGDLATMDAEGYVVITGRIKDMIIRGGENIYPKEIEEYLRTHPSVSDVAVYGIPSRKYGEEVGAAVKLRPGSQATAEELRAYCEGNISKFKIPRYLHFVDSFPMTASGKIQKFVLRERASLSEKKPATDFTDSTD